MKPSQTLNFASVLAVKQHCACRSSAVSCGGCGGHRPHTRNRAALANNKFHRYFRFNQVSCAKTK